MYMFQKRSAINHWNVCVALCLLIMSSVLPIPMAWASSPGDGPLAAGTIWGAAVNLVPDNIGYAMRPDVSADGTVVVYLNDPNGSTDLTKEIKVVEYSGGAWGTPKTLASNAINDTGSFVWMPRYTYPVVSGNGNVIAYLGYTAATGKNEIYIIERTGGVWGAPYVLQTGLENHHYWVSISGDGNTVAYSDYAFWDAETLYVSTRTGGVWGSPVAVSSKDAGSAGQFAMSPDATKLVWAQNYCVVYSEKVDGAWGTPQWLTTREIGDTYYYFADYPRIIADGSAVFYRATKVVGTTETEQNHYVIRRSGQSWATPEKVNSATLIPSIYLDAPAAVNATGSMLIYHRGVVSGDTMYAAYLEESDYAGGAWTTRAVTNTASGYDRDPKLTPDGSRLVYSGPLPSGYYTIWLKQAAQTETHTLATTKLGAGTGTVKSEPAGILCGDACSADFAAGATVTLTATPDTGSIFKSWSGCASKSGATCTVTMNAEKSVTATFAIAPPAKLTVSKVKRSGGNGAIQSVPAGIDCGKSCAASFTPGTQVALTATPDTNSVFAGWSIDGCTGTSCSFLLTGNQTVKGTFIGPQTIKVTNRSMSKGGGTVTSDKGGINCTSGSKGTCKASYPYNTGVTLTATADSGSVFSGWSGCAAFSDTTCAVTADKTKTVKASFTGPQPLP